MRGFDGETYNEQSKFWESVEPCEFSMRLLNQILSLYKKYQKYLSHASPEEGGARHALNLVESDSLYKKFVDSTASLQQVVTLLCCNTMCHIHQFFIAFRSD